ncbi:hypothetical protein GTW69_21285 [Streptomyces sp. SID7760]|nr:hypothetical protein [Streptomyces sp. SID7760]
MLPQKGERMHAPRPVTVAVAIAAVGAVLVLASALTEESALFRIGLVPLLCGLAGAVSARNHQDNVRLLAFQAQAARLTARERQRYTELGWRAAEINTRTAAEQAEPAGDIVPFPKQPTPLVHRDGGAQAGT